MLKEVGASGQISLGKKYAGQLFDLTVQSDGSIVMQPVKVVPVVQEQAATYEVSVASVGDGWLTPERLARRAAAAARSPAETQALRDKWEEDNKDAIDAMNKRMAKIGSMGMRIHEWRKAKVS
ncbi:MAG: hypothetical protein RL392_1972 [Pseudomonadota bacterium]|jgi:hypothetical protein